MKLQLAVFFAVASLVALLPACASPASDSIEHEESAEAALSPTGQGDDYVFVWLKTGGATDLSDEESSAASAGHFANMDRLFKERFLVVAGPLGQPRIQPDHRGIFIFDVDTVERALALTKTDPAVKAGVFAFDIEPFHCTANLRSVFALEDEAEANGTQGMRGYVIATSEHGTAAEAAVEALAEEGLVALSGRIGGEREGTSLFVLMCETRDEASEMLSFASGDQDLAWQIAPWYGSVMVEQITQQ